MLCGGRRGLGDFSQPAPKLKAADTARGYARLRERLARRSQIEHQYLSQLLQAC